MRMKSSVWITKFLGNKEKKEREKAIRRWYIDRGDETHRLFYPGINQNSIVFDVGGYYGQWTSDIYSIYRCKIHIFEPVTYFADNIEKRFALNPDIHVHKFGLSSESKKSKITVDRDSSSFFLQGPEQIDATLVCFSEFISAENIDFIDLMKINIEGAEYDLLEHILNRDLAGRINNIQVQFHNFIENCGERMFAIQKKLGETHQLTYQYLYVWENWEKKTKK